MEKLYLCMKYELPEILIDEELRLKSTEAYRGDVGSIEEYKIKIQTNY